MYSIDSIKHMLTDDYEDLNRVRYACLAEWAGGDGTECLHLHCMQDMHRYDIEDSYTGGYNPPEGTKCFHCGKPITRVTRNQRLNHKTNYKIPYGG